MSLKIWLPLNGNIENQGLADVTITNNGATVDNNGKIGKCYSFNGGTITAPAPKITNKITVAAWIKAPDNNSGWRRVCGMQSAAISWQSASALLMLNGTNLYFSISNGSTCTSGGCAFNISDSSNWFHACGTYDGTTARLYVNGVLKKECAIATTIENTPIWLGGTSAGERFTGKLNDFRIYDHCLSSKEVKEIAKGLVLHYPLNDAYVQSTTNLNKSIGTNWTNWGTNTITKDSFISPEGTQGSHVNCSSYTSGGIYVSHSSFSVKPNTTYVISAKMKLTGYTHSNLFYWREYDSSNTKLSESGKWSSTRFIEYGHGYKLYYGTVTTASTASTVSLHSFFYGIGEHWIYDIQVEEGSYPTPFVGYNASRTATTVYDCSGYQNNGTITGALSCSADSPRYKTCVQTSSSGKIQKDIILPSAITHYTISVWCKITDPNAAANLWTKHSNGSKGIIQGPDGGWVYSYNGVGLVTRTSFLTTSGTITQTYPGFGQNCKDGNWHMYTIIGNGNINTCYLDGVMTGRRTLSNFVSYNINGQLNIGFTEECLMSDYRVYATALSEEDIKELYNTSAYVLDNGTLLTYNLEE